MQAASPSSSRTSTPGAPREDPRRALGRLGEQLAATHLERLGFAILARNARTRYGEIDLIACDGHTIVFVEVKTRRRHSRAPDREADLEPLARLRPRQRARVRRLAVAWLSTESSNRPTALAIRFDAVGLILDVHDALLRLDHIEAAW